MARRYSKSAIADEASYQIKLEKTREYMNAETEVLEFGCGTGSTAILHAPFVKHIHATDISDKMLNFAREKKAAQNISNVDFECTSIEELDAENHRYDMILGLNILHLLTDKDAAISKAFELLRPGGTFVSSTVLMAEMNPIFRIILPIGRTFGLLPILTFFNADGLVASLTNAGFAIEHQWNPGKPTSVFIIARKPA